MILPESKISEDKYSGNQYSHPKTKDLRNKKNLVLLLLTTVKEFWH